MQPCSLIAKKPLWFVDDDAPEPPPRDPSHGMYAGALRCTDGPAGVPGHCWGGPYLADDTWQAVAPGVHVRLADATPQSFLRLRQHPLVQEHRQVRVPTCAGGVWWVPVLLQPLDERDPGAGLVSALDRVITYRDDAPLSAGDLDGLLRALFELACGVPQVDGEDTPEARTLAAARLAVRVLQVTHHVGTGEIAAAGWMTERTAFAILWAAIGMDPADVTSADASDAPAPIDEGGAA